MDVNSRDPLQNIIPFRIKGVEISRFDSSGNLKIGTTTTTAPTVRLDISGGSARVNSGSATSTALTTVGRIGVNMATPTVDLDVSGVARMAALSATSTALTTVGRIGVNQSAPTVPLDVVGAAKIAGELNMSSNKIVNLNTPTAAADAATKGYVDTKTTDVATTAFVTGNTWVNNPTITRIDTLDSIIYITGVSGPPADNTTARRELYMDSHLYYKPSTNTLTSEVFSGTLTGNATSATSATSALSAANISNASSHATFTINGSERMRINSGGDIVMGNSPQNNSSFLLNNSGVNYQGKVTLVVKPLSNASQNRPYYLGESAILFVNTSGGYSEAAVGFGNNIDPAQSNASQPFGGFFVAFFEGGIQCDFVIIASDKRMKKNITEINNDKPLQLLRKIKCSTFEYIDKIKNSTYTVHGFIAQDIKDVVPESVHTVKDFLPNFYCNCIVEKDRVDEDSKKQIYRVFIPENPIKQLLFTGNHDIYGTEYKTTTGMPASDALGNQQFVVKLYDSSNNEINVETIKIIDEYSFLISVEWNEKGENDKMTEKMYFLYGQQVDDFHKIDNDHIHNIATAALQEVDRQQQADKARIAELENQVSNLEATVGSLESTVASQQSLINDILERLKTNGM